MMRHNKAFINYSPVILVFVVLAIGTVSAAVAPAIEWQKVLGGNDRDLGSGIRQTTDGGYILVGSVNSNSNGNVGLNHGLTDAWVVRLNSAGTIQWQRMLGGNNIDYGFGIDQTHDGGFILIGSTRSNNNGDVGPGHGSSDIWVVKLNNVGTIQWQKLLGGNGWDSGNSIQQTSDGGYILTGRTGSSNNGDVGPNHGGDDVWVVKLDSTGTIQWQKVLGGNGMEEGYSVEQTKDGGYIVIGNTNSNNNGDVGPNHGYYDFWVVRLNSAGTIQWQKVLGGNGWDDGYSVQQTSDGGYILTGRAGSNNNGDVGPNHGGDDFWVVKLNSAGTIQWQKMLGGSYDDHGRSIRQTTDGGYILTGHTSSNNNGDVGPNHGSDDFWVVKLNSAGAIQWQKVLGGIERDGVYGADIRETKDGGFILAGDTLSSSSGDVGQNHGNYDFWVVKLRSQGSITGITVTNPNGGNNWKQGSAQTITWSYTGSPGSSVKIELLKGTAVNRVITSSTSIGSAGSGSMSWTVPYSQVTGTDYRVRVTSLSSSLYNDTSNAYFTISAPVSGAGLFRPASGQWFFDINLNGGTDKTFTWGTNGDIPLTGDFNGDGKTDIALFRNSTGTWYFDTNLNGGTDKTFTWGTRGDIPLTGDFNGDGKTDIALFRPASGQWFFDINLNGGTDKTFTWGTRGDIPLTGDFNGGGITDIALFRPSTGKWYFDINLDGGTDKSFVWGTYGDIPLTGDFNGDGVSELAIFRPSTGNWYFDTDRNGVTNLLFHWGTYGDIPLTGDFNGDGKTDIALFRPASGQWFFDINLNGGTDKAFTWGMNGDKPLVGRWI